MARQIVNIGTQGNDGTGDSIREAFRKVNENFRDLYAIFDPTGQIVSTQLLDDFPDSYSSNQILITDGTGSNILAKTIQAGTGISITNNPENLIIGLSNLDVLATQNYVNDNFVNIDGTSVMTGPLILRNTFDNDNEAVSKGYVDSKTQLSTVNLYVSTSGTADEIIDDPESTNQQIADSEVGRSFSNSLNSIAQACRKAEILTSDVNSVVNVTIWVESGIYEEHFPIKVPRYVTIKGDDADRVTISPAAGESASYWNDLYFYRDSSFDGLTISTVNGYGYHYLTDPLDVSSTPKNNNEIDAFILNDLSVITNVTVQTGPGFAIVADPDHCDATLKDVIIINNSIDNLQTFGGGAFIDNYARKQTATVSTAETDSVNLVLTNVNRKIVSDVGYQIIYNNQVYLINDILMDPDDSTSTTVNVTLAEGSEWLGDVGVQVILEPQLTNFLTISNVEIVGSNTYGIVSVNGAEITANNLVTYHTWTSQYAVNGGRIYSSSGITNYGEFGIKAEGSDLDEVPDTATLVDPMIQIARVYKEGSYASDNDVNDTSVYIDTYLYEPYNISELEINHSVAGITRYRIVNHEVTDQVGGSLDGSTTTYVLKLNLDTNTTPLGLKEALSNNDFVTIRCLQNFKFGGLDTIGVKDSATLEFTSNEESGVYYKTLQYDVNSSTESTITFNTSFDYINLYTDIAQLDTVDAEDAGKKLGSTVGDLKIAVETITDQRIIDRLNSGLMRFGWNGNVFKVLGHGTQGSSPVVHYIRIENGGVGEGSIDTVTGYPGISAGFSTTVRVPLRIGLKNNVPVSIVNNVSTCQVTSHYFNYVGTGLTEDIALANPEYEVVEVTTGQVFYTSTDQLGTFRVGNYFSVNQNSGDVTLSGSISLSDLDGLGFKRGVVVKEFSTDSGLTGNDIDVVPVESAVRGYVDRRLGTYVDGNDVDPGNLLGSGFLPIDGSKAMSGELTLSGTPVNSTSAVPRSYVDSLIGAKASAGTELAATLGLASFNSESFTTNGNGWVSIANNGIKLTKIETINNNRLLGNFTGGAAAPSQYSVKDVFNSQFSSGQGVLVRTDVGGVVDYGLRALSDPSSSGAIINMGADGYINVNNGIKINSEKILDVVGTSVILRANDATPVITIASDKTVTLVGNFTVPSGSTLSGPGIIATSSTASTLTVGASNLAGSTSAGANTIAVRDGFGDLYAVNFRGSLAASNLTGTVSVTNGGTGRSTLTTNGILIGNGTSGITATAAPTVNGQVPTWNGTTWGYSVPGSVSTAVTGVGLSLPTDVFTISGSPINPSTGPSSGTLTGTFKSQTGNLVFASPNGSSGAPSFRSLVAADIPTITPAQAGITIGGNVQAYDADLAAIAGLAGTTGLLRKTDANTWSLDTNDYYRAVDATGDVTGAVTSTGTVKLTLASTGVTPGTYNSFTVDAKGRITNASNVSGGGTLSDAAPLVNGVAAAGVSAAASRGDHVHPTDTSRAPVNSPVFTGTVTLSNTVSSPTGTQFSFGNGTGMSFNQDGVIRMGFNPSWPEGTIAMLDATHIADNALYLGTGFKASNAIFGSFFGSTGNTIIARNSSIITTFGATTVTPGVDNAISLGASGLRWSRLWAATSTISTSDARQKNTIKESDLGLEFINKLRPVSYKWNEGGRIPVPPADNSKIQTTTESTPVPGKRTHYGLIAQEVKQVLGEKDFGGYVDSGTELGLRYEEFIAPLIKAVQELSAKVTALTARVQELETKVK